MNSSKNNLPPENGWEAAELSTLQEGARLTFRERLLWLQDMLEFAERFGGAASGRKLDRDGNIILVQQTVPPPVAQHLEPAVAEDQSPYQSEPPSAPTQP